MVFLYIKTKTYLIFMSQIEIHVWSPVADLREWEAEPPPTISWTLTFPYPLTIPPLPTYDLAAGSRELHTGISFGSLLFTTRVNLRPDFIASHAQTVQPRDWPNSGSMVPWPRTRPSSTRPTLQQWDRGPDSGPITAPGGHDIQLRSLWTLYMMVDVRSS